MIAAVLKTAVVITFLILAAFRFGFALLLKPTDPKHWSDWQ
jgi:hypothetical protein